jgi:hypothetical protein
VYERSSFDFGYVVCRSRYFDVDPDVVESGRVGTSRSDSRNWLECDGG